MTSLLTILLSITEIEKTVLLITTYGATTVFFAVGMLLLYRYLKNKIDCANNKEIKFDLTKHTFFTGMLEYDRSVDSIGITNKLKKEMAIKFLKTKIKVFRNDFSDFINQKNYDNLYPEHLYAEIVLIFEKCISRYEREVREDGVPEIFIEKFNEWHKSRVDSTLYGIKLFLQSSIATSNHSKLYNVLNMIQIAFMQTVEDAEYTLNSLNGELEKELKRIQDLKENKAK